MPDKKFLDIDFVKDEADFERVTCGPALRTGFKVLKAIAALPEPDGNWDNGDAEDERLMYRRIYDLAHAVTKKADDA